MDVSLQRETSRGSFKGIHDFFLLRCFLSAENFKLKFKNREEATVNRRGVKHVSPKEAFKCRGFQLREQSRETLPLTSTPPPPMCALTGSCTVQGMLGAYEPAGVSSDK